MATAQTHKLSRVRRHNLRSALYGTRCVPKEPRKQILPGIGTYMIDSPKDKNSSVRQQCLRYQEAHRGIIRARIDSLPDIPKRCGMKSMPIVQLKETYDMSTSPVNFDLDTPPSAPSPDVGIDQFESKHRHMERLLRRQENGYKVLPQEEMVSRSPIGRMVQGKQTAPIAGFGVRRKSKPSGAPRIRKEYTNLSVNVELSPPGPAPSRATDRELMSQAEYRKQLTFYLTQMGEDGSIHRSDTAKDDDDSKSDMDTVRSLIINIPADNIGHTTKYNVWASNLRLGEVLINNSTPDIKRKLAGSRNRNIERLKRSITVKNKTPVYRDDDSDEDDEEAWLHVVNTPVVDRDVYDRYANVKLPPSSRMQLRGRVSK